MLSSIYLSGGATEGADLAVQMPQPDWRSFALTKLQRYGLRVVNPLELAWSAIDRPDVIEITEGLEIKVRRALDLIDQADVLLANLNKSSYATAMEMFYAHRRGKMVTVIGQSPFSPWVLSHSQARFADIDRALDYLIDEHPHAEPLDWAVQHETHLSERYEQLPPAGEPDYRFLGGDFPVMALAPHATAYWREGEFQEADTFTGSLAALLHRLSGSHAFISDYSCVADPCWHLETPMRRALVDIIKVGRVGLVMIILGSAWHETPGFQLSAYGKSESVMEEYTGRLKLKLAAIEPVVMDENDIYTRPLARFIGEELDCPTLVLKMHKRYRMPRIQPQLFMKAFSLINEFLGETGLDLARSLA